MDFGIDTSDPFGVASSFLVQSMANQFTCHDQLLRLLNGMTGLETPLAPGDDSRAVLAQIDNLLALIEPEPGSIELVEALLRLGSEFPPQTPSAQRLFRSVLWVAMRHDPMAATPTVLQIMRDATPGARSPGSAWPGHDFFASVLVLACLGGPGARGELRELLRAAQDLGYHDLAPVIEWFLDDPRSTAAS